MNFAGGVYTFPDASRGFKISNSATVLAIASQMLASARACPGQALMRAGCRANLDFFLTSQTILTSFLISFFLDCLFYGIFFVAYAITMWLLLFAARRRKGQSRSRDMAHAGLLTVMLGLAFVVRTCSPIDI